MGLIRVTGGNDGIEEYLKNGQKEGRAFSRDELDERVVLDGDLELTNAVIQSIDSEGERYLHLTFSLKEDDITAEKLKAISDEIKAFTFSAYRPDEYSFYAEAHLPKIKSYVNSRDGSLVERKPHLHAVIPKVNLLSGQLLDPLGKETQQEKFIDALQEHINNKFGLASPKEHRRIVFTDASDMIARYKGDLFAGQNAELRQSILNTMLDREIRDYDAFRALVAEHGETRARNAGKPTEYLNVKPAEAGKGVNLKDYVFTREFVELPQEEKLRRLATDIQRKYETSDAARRDPDHIAATLREWHEIRAKEVKYINSGNRKFFAEYKAASREEKLQILADRESRFYTKHDQEIHHDDAERARAYIDEHLERITDNLGAADRHILTARRTAGNLDRAAGRLANRRVGRAVAAALRGRGRDQGHPENPRFRERRRPVDNVVGQRQAEARERANRASAEELGEFAKIRKNIDARRFLSYLASSHGVIIEKYEIVKGKDGSDRIRCGKRNLNVSDYLTQELNLSFAEAAPILREAYAAQMTGRHERVHVRAEPTKSMWQEFRGWKDQHYKTRGSDWTAQRDSEAKRRAAIKQKFQHQKADLNARGGLSRAERRAVLSIARMERVRADQALRAQIDMERAAIKSRYGVKPVDLYRVYLQERAQAGDTRALAELRRQRIEPSAKPSKTEAYIASPTPGATPARDAEPLLNLSYTVGTNGDVTYQFQGRDVIRDEAGMVRVLDDDRRVAETALRLAVQKFGPKLTVNGTPEFKRLIVEIAVEKGMRIEFNDPALNALRDRLQKEKAPVAAAPKAAESRTQPKPQPEAPTPKETYPMEANRYTEGRGRRRTDAERLEEERKFLEDVEIAKSCDLPSELELRGVKVKKNGAKEYKIDNGDGQEADRLFPSKRDGRWMAYVPGGDRQYMDAIDYLRRHTGEGYRETVLKLAGAMNGNPAQVAKVARDSRAAGKRENKMGTQIMLRVADQQQKERIYRYARDERGITRETLAEAAKQGVIAADDRGLVFLGRDEHGNIRNAETRLLSSIKVDGKDVNKLCYEGTDKTYPPILRGNDREVHFCEGGMDCLALRDMYLREGKQPPTTIITGGARTLKWEDNPQIQQLIQGAEHVRPWEDNELDKIGQPDLKKQADTTAAHDNQVAAIVRLRGTADGVERMRPPEGIKDIAAWNKIEAEHHQVQQQAQQRQEQDDAASPRPGR